MGSTLHWREEPGDRENRSFGRTIAFGAGRNAGRGYMAYSDRVGPGIVIVGDHSQGWIRAFADELNTDGFTVLVPELTASDPADVVVGAADHLADNWHPRLGLIGVSAGAALAVEVARVRAVDALALYDPPGDLDLSGVDQPMVVHLTPSADAHEQTAELFHYELS